MKNEPAFTAPGTRGSTTAGMSMLFAMNGSTESEAANVRDPFPLWRVAMPIARLMRKGQLTWAQMEECAWALQEALRQHDSLMREHNEHMQAACCKQASNAMYPAKPAD